MWQLEDWLDRLLKEHIQYTSKTLGAYFFVKSRELDSKVFAIPRKNIQNALKISDKSIYLGLIELERKGYIDVTRYRNGKQPTKILIKV